MSENLSNINNKNNGKPSAWENSSELFKDRHKKIISGCAAVALFACSLPALSACGSSNEAKPGSSSSQTVDNKTNNNKANNNKANNDKANYNKANKGDENQNHYNPHRMTYLLKGKAGGEAKVTFSGKLAEKFDVTEFAKNMEEGAKGLYDVSKDRNIWVAIGLKNPKKKDASGIRVTLEDVNKGVGEYDCAFNQKNNSDDSSVCDIMVGSGKGSGNMVYNNVDDPSTLYTYAATVSGFIEGHYETYANNDLKQIVATYVNDDPGYVGEYMHSALKIVKKNPDGNLRMSSENDWSSIDDNRVAVVQVIYADDNPSNDYVESLLNSDDIKIEFEN